MKLKLSAIALLAMIAPAVVPAQARAGMLTDAEATFLDQLVTAAAVLEQRCSGYEANGAGGVQLGARLLGSPDAAMDIIYAYDAAIKALDGKAYDPAKYRPEVAEAADQSFRKLQAILVKDPTSACADYGDTSAARGLLRRY